MKDQMPNQVCERVTISFTRRKELHRIAEKLAEQVQEMNIKDEERCLLWSMVEEHLLEF